MSDSSSTSESGSTPKSSTAERNLDDFNKDAEREGKGKGKEVGEASSSKKIK